MFDQSKQFASLGGKARSEALTAERRKAIAVTAANARWQKQREADKPERAPEPQPDSEKEGVQNCTPSCAMERLLAQVKVLHC
jgi:hypothetical protein